MRNICELIELWPRANELARELGISPPRISDWKNRNSIPVAYWRELICAAQRRGLSEVTAELLVDLHARDVSGGRTGFDEEERSFETRTEGQPPAAEPGKTGHFSRFKHLRRANFATIEEVNEHIRALRDEWDRR